MRYVLAFCLLVGCGSSSTSGSTASDTACPTGGHEPVEGPDGIYENCEVLFEGCCYVQQSDACAAANCDNPCEIMESYPGQLRRCE